MPAKKTALLWFRNDLRLQDNPALRAAFEHGVVIPVFILDADGENGDEGRWSPGAASRWWLHHSLEALDASLRARGSRLVLRRGPAEEVLAALFRETGADALFWNRRYEPTVIARDARIKARFVEEGREVRSFNGALLHEPHAVRNKQGGPFQVFTPYWKHCLGLPVAPAVPFEAKKIPAPSEWPESLALPDFGLLPGIPWDAEFPRYWKPGEAGATERLHAFARGGLRDYREARDVPAEDGTSLLSPALHFGEVSPRQIWSLVEARARAGGGAPDHGSPGVFLKEVGWREFAHHLLFHFPETPQKPLREEFARFPWARDPGGKKLEAWRRGLTGYPIVDAGMRQLWRSGWMHNRVRMIAASFLVKHLRLPWNEGAEWFWDTLVDADLANNTLGWQWTAGCGADAAPYFRVFNPILQGKKFDARGDYVRNWVPELAKVPAQWIHAPWEAPAEVLSAAGVSLGKTYPKPIVDHAAARAEALQAFQDLKKA